MKLRLIVFVSFPQNSIVFSLGGNYLHLIVICNNPIMVKFVIVNVNTVQIRLSQQNVVFRTFSVDALFENEELRPQLSFLDIKIHKQTSHWTSIRKVIVKRKFILEVERPPDHEICPLLRY